MINIEKLLEEAVVNSCIRCRKCSNNIEADCKVCSCGWINPLVEQGYI